MNRAAFGLCWGAFHIVAKVWGDCTAVSGKLEGGDIALKASMEEFVEFLRGDEVGKVFYVQFSDGGFFEPPLGKGHRFWVEGMDERLIWSRNARPFPMEGELRGYFPILEIVRDVLGEGKGAFKGWVSFEVFDWSLEDEG